MLYGLVTKVVSTTHIIDLSCNSDNHLSVSSLHSLPPLLKRRGLSALNGLVCRATVITASSILGVKKAQLLSCAFLLYIENPALDAGFKKA